MELKVFEIEVSIKIPKRAILTQKALHIMNREE